MELLMSFYWSQAIPNSRSGYSFFTRSSFSKTAWAVLTVFAPLCLETVSPADGRDPGQKQSSLHSKEGKAG